MADADQKDAVNPASQSPGLSYTDMLKMDTRKVPDFLMDESQQDLGTHPLSTERYTSSEFARLEAEKMWPKFGSLPLVTRIFQTQGIRLFLIMQESLSFWFGRQMGM